jgi:anti-sigma factor RsiW
MTCPDVESRIDLYAADECGAAEADAIRRHLGECPRCASACEEARQVVSLLDLRLQEPDRLRRLHARLAAEGAPRRRVLRLPVPLRRAAALAAMLLITLGLVGWLTPGLKTAETDGGLVAVLAPQARLNPGMEMARADRKQAPDVELTLTLRNAGDRSLRVWVEGPQAELSLEVSGPGTVRVPVAEEPAPQPRVVTLAPGESYTHRVTPPAGRLWNWTKAGDYTLRARLTTTATVPGMSPRRITVHSEPLTIHVDGP